MEFSKQENQRGLIEQLKQGDETAMKHIFRLYYSRLHYFSVQIIGDSMDAEDIVQEAFLNFWLNIREKDVTPDNIQAYLYTMVRNRCLNYLERNRTIEQKTGEVIEHFREQARRQMDEIALKEEIYHRLHKEFIHLTPIQVQVIRLLYIEGLSVAEVAEKLGTTPANVRTHKFRAMERLTKGMKDQFFTSIIFFLIFFDLL